MSAKKNPPAGNRGAETNSSGRDNLQYTGPRQLREWMGAQGFHLFPLIPGTKRPMVRDWERKATNDPQALADWPARAGVGVACGPSGIVVIDLDCHSEDVPQEWADRGCADGADVFAWLWNKNTTTGDSWAHTLTVATPSGGGHLYYRAPADAPVRNSAGRIGWQIDVRSVGGYAATLGTTLPNGSYEELYVPQELPVLPDWLTALAAPPRAVQSPRRRVWALPSRTGGRVQALAEKVATAQPGQRNHVLNWAAYQLAVDHVLTRENAEILCNAGLAAGLGEGECVATINSAARGTEVAA